MKILCIYLFVVFLFIACRSTEKGFLLTVDKKTPNYFLDSTLRALNQTKYVEQGNYRGDITQVTVLNRGYDQFAFISMHNEALSNGSISYPNKLYISLFWVDKWVLKDSLTIDEMMLYEPDSIWLQDVNFDNQLDFVLDYPTLIHNREIHEYQLLLVDKQTNMKKRSISSTDIIEFVPSTKSIMTWADGGYFSQAKLLHSWRADTLQLVRSIIGVENGKGFRSDIEEKFFENGKLVKTINKKFNDSDEAYEYFESWE